MRIVLRELARHGVGLRAQSDRRGGDVRDVKKLLVGAVRSGRTPQSPQLEVLDVRALRVDGVDDLMKNKIQSAAVDTTCMQQG